MGIYGFRKNADGMYTVGCFLQHTPFIALFVVNNLERAIRIIGVLNGGDPKMLVNLDGLEDLQIE